MLCEWKLEDEQSGIEAMPKSLTAQGFLLKTRVGVLHSPIKLFNTPTLIQVFYVYSVPLNQTQMRKRAVQTVLGHRRTDQIGGLF